MNHLPNSFYVYPDIARTTMTTKQWQETVKATDGYIIACGHGYDLKSSSMGGGMRKVWLVSAQ